MVGVSPHLQATDRLRRLAWRLRTQADFQGAWRQLLTNRTAVFDSVWGSSCALVVAALAHEIECGESSGSLAPPRQVLVIAPTAALADDFADDLESFCPQRMERFPALESSRTADDRIDLTLGERARILKQLRDASPPVLLCTSVQALLQRVPAESDLHGGSRSVALGDSIDAAEFRGWLVQAGFSEVPVVQLPGEFSVRGGILDVFAPDWLQPARIELFDDVVESIRQFDPQSQRSIAPLQRVDLTLAQAIGAARDSLLSHLDPDCLLVLIELEEIQAAAQQFLDRHIDAEGLDRYDQLQQRWAAFRLVCLQRLAIGGSEESIRLPFESVEAFRGDATEVRVQLDHAVGLGEVLLVARVDGEIPRLQELLQTTDAAMRGGVDYAVGCIHAGFRWRDQNLLVIGADQIFHRGQLRRIAQRKLGRVIDSFLDLRDGDLIVHLAHGIGRYRGLALLEKGGLLTEHLELEFHGGTRIFVPATKIDLVQKYIGGTKTRPVLARIGGKSWVKQKEATAAAITDLAAEMLEVQARRSGAHGIAYGEDTTWQHEFEQSFPFRETADQLTAIGAIKRDMQSPQPMDRLLCGDVCFGKTEIAARAAFKAVENGYQVAILVPTTVLAEQHFRTFTERMAEFPFDLARLSRFSSSDEIRQTLVKLKSGQIDVVIGTHRLLSQDVEFHNLGLVVVDEEQRFGVHHKERLKSWRNNVDILTMSATPIPRTLHMSLVGVRDISNLETPPEDRVPVETHSTRYNHSLIRQAILRELDRGGQVYFVHNRVNDIQQLREELADLVPEATIRVGHAQMDDDELDRVMTEFIGGKFDVLLSTTIVESGLDIPNANTMIIDEADRFGLSELHQLRGRVGRYKHRAYCYLLIRDRKHLTPVAAKRLHAIETFSELGAGFAIAMRDLEIRGAGNLLGTEQSGHIAAVGYELYCQMLETAVRRLKQMPQKIAVHVDVDLPGIAYLPDDYIPDRRQKLDFYRRMTRVERFDEITQLREELVDRFGAIPSPVERLLELAEIKLEAAIWQIDTIFQQDRFLGFRYQNRTRIQQLAARHQGKLRIVDEQNAFVELRTPDLPHERLLALLKAILKPGG